MTAAPLSPSPSHEMQPALEDELQACLKLLNGETYRPLADMIVYHMGLAETSTQSKGKRLRPLLTLLSCQAAGGDWRLALPAASSVELIHSFSLIHDDIEDQSHTRRGRLTVWKRWGVAQAINAGDAVFGLARLAGYRMLQDQVPARTTLRVMATLDQACLDLTMGQYLDLAFEERNSVDQDSYLQMIAGKTASLLASACKVGALVAESDSTGTEHYRVFGYHLGMAFQIVDDILGIWGSPEVTGKPAGDDLLSRKKTLPVLYGLQNSPTFAELWSRRASNQDDLASMTQALEEASANAYAWQVAERHTHEACAALEAAGAAGGAADELGQLAEQLLNRKR